MKAFKLFSNEEIELRKLLRKLQEYGEINCNFETFTKIYVDWFKITFPGRDFNPSIAINSDDWFLDFLKFLASKNI